MSRPSTTLSLRGISKRFQTQEVLTDFSIENAHTFINFMLRPEGAKECTEYVGYATASQSALALMDESLRNNPAVFRPESIVEQGEFQADVGDAIEIYNKYWEMLKTGR